MITNREKYKFDDFTLDNYRRLIELAKEKGFNFISFPDEFVPERKDILWRHDVEFEPDIALEMADIENCLFILIVNSLGIERRVAVVKRRRIAWRAIAAGEVNCYHEV